MSITQNALSKLDEQIIATAKFNPKNQNRETIELRLDEVLAILKVAEQVGRESKFELRAFGNLAHRGQGGETSQLTSQSIDPTRVYSLAEFKRYENPHTNKPDTVYNILKEIFAESVQGINGFHLRQNDQQVKLHLVYSSSNGEYHININNNANYRVMSFY